MLCWWLQCGHSCQYFVSTLILFLIYFPLLHFLFIFFYSIILFFHFCAVFTTAMSTLMPIFCLNFNFISYFIFRYFIFHFYFSITLFYITFVAIFTTAMSTLMPIYSLGDSWVYTCTVILTDCTVVEWLYTFCTLRRSPIRGSEICYTDRQAGDTGTHITAYIVR